MSRAESLLRAIAPRRATPRITAAVVAATLALPLSAAAQAATVPGAPWARLAEKAAFDPLVPSLAKRPSVLLETDYYVYGPGTGFSEPRVELTINDRNYTDPVSLYVYWQNRASGATQYFSLATGGFGATERDVFGSPADPTAIITPDLTGFRLFAPAGTDSAFGPLPGSLPVTTGRYQLVVELRDANGANVVARSNAMYSYVDAVIAKSGTINSNETWTSDNAYFLAAPVNVDGATLTIQKGTVILGSNANQGTLVVRRGAQIQAVGDAMDPIVFTSEREVGQRRPGDWGGLVINGSAPTNQVDPQGEGNSGPYGGNDAGDSSGRLSYVRVEFAGIRFSDQNELNGIAFQGVGTGTQLDHLQVSFNQDDGIEFFGGTAEAKYVLITDAEDDSLDWAFGWTGKLQHFVALQRTGRPERLIEADNFEDGFDALPRSSPMIANATFYGNKGIAPLGDEGEGWRLRRGTAGNFTHAIIVNAFNECLRVTDNSPDFLGGLLQIRNSLFFGCGGAGVTDDPAVLDYLEAPGNNNFLEVNPGITNGLSLIHPDVTANNAPNPGALPVEFRNDPFFDNVSYLGGVSKNDPWVEEGWVSWSDN